MLALLAAIILRIVPADPPKPVCVETLPWTGGRVTSPEAPAAGKVKTVFSQYGSTLIAEPETVRARSCHAGRRQVA